jgi:hypothetical protein
MLGLPRMVGHLERRHYTWQIVVSDYSEGSEDKSFNSRSKPALA